MKAEHSLASLQSGSDDGSDPRVSDGSDGDEFEDEGGNESDEKEWDDDFTPDSDRSDDGDFTVGSSLVIKYIAWSRLSV